jgi:lipoprotein
MKRILLVVLTIVALSCDKDKDLPNIDYQFDVKTQNKNVEKGLEVGKTVKLSYLIDLKYKRNNHELVKYELVSDKKFEAVDNLGNNIELNKQYSFDFSKDSLLIRYKGKESGEHKIKLNFINHTNYSVTKEMSLKYDGFGAYFSRGEKEQTITGEDLLINYSLSIGENDPNGGNYVVTIVEDEANGYFSWNKNGTVLAKKGQSFEIIPSDSEQKLYYRTYNPTAHGKLFDKIVLEVKPKNGNLSQKETFVISQKFVNNVLKMQVNHIQNSNKIKLYLKSDIEGDNNEYYTSLLATKKTNVNINIPDHEGVEFKYSNFSDELSLVDGEFFYEIEGNQKKQEEGIFLKANKEYIATIKYNRKEKIYINTLTYKGKEIPKNSKLNNYVERAEVGMDYDAPQKSEYPTFSFILYSEIQWPQGGYTSTNLYISNSNHFSIPEPAKDKIKYVRIYAKSGVLSYGIKMEKIFSIEELQSSDLSNKYTDGHSIGGSYKIEILDKDQQVVGSTEKWWQYKSKDEVKITQDDINWYY